MEITKFESAIHIPTDFFDDIQPLTPSDLQVWIPPRPGRFVVLGPEDECWARWLGIGKEVSIWEAWRMKLDKMIVQSLGIPPSLLQSANFSSNYRCHT